MRIVRSSRLRGIAFAAAFVAACAGASVIVQRLPGPVVDRMIRTDIERHALLWKQLVLDVLDDAEGAFTAGRLTPEAETALGYIPAASDIYRFKLFQPDGTVFWSSRPSDIGTVNSKDYFSDLVAKGTSHYIVLTLPPSEIDTFRAKDTHAWEDRTVVEIYTPIMAGGRFVGAIEFYTDVTETRSAFVTRVRALLAAVSGAALLLMTLVAVGVARSGAAQMRELRERSEKEQTLTAAQIRLAREVRLLGELNEWLQSSRSLDELYDMVSRFLAHILPGCEGSVYVYSNSRDVLDGCISWNGGIHKDHIRPEDCWGLRRGRTYAFGTSEVDFTCNHAEPHDGRPYFCFPILAHGETVGLLHLSSAEGASSDGFRSVQKLAQMCAEQISMAIANVRMRDELQDQSVRDPLTGLFNRRHLMDTLRRRIDRARGGATRLAAVSVDVDHFKKFNDNHGHDAGDMALRAVGTALQQFCDGDEIACRMGGEEFMILVPDTTEVLLGPRLERLRAGIEEIRVRYGERLLPRITASFGVAFHPSGGSLPQDLIRASDEALYEAKAKGRNQVVFACDLPADQDPDARAAVVSGVPAPAPVAAE